MVKADVEVDGVAVAKNLDPFEAGEVAWKEAEKLRAEGTWNPRRVVMVRSGLRQRA
jgi:hypothetical protein